jgi:integrase
MAKLIEPGKLKRTIYVNEGGKRVPKSTPGARREVWTNKKYYIRYKKNGKTQNVAAKKDQRSSLKMLERIELGDVGVDPLQEHRVRPVSEHLADYLVIVEGRDIKPKHKVEIERILKAMLAKMGISSLGDLTIDKIERYIAKLDVAPGTKKKHYHAMSGFVKWLYRKDRLSENFMYRMDPPRGGVVKEVRSLTHEEVQKVLNATRIRPLQEAMTRRTGPKKGTLTADVRPEVRARLVQEGRERGLLYKTAVETGLRKEELARFRVWFIDFDSHKPKAVVNFPAECTKTKKPARLWLRESLANELREWIKDTGKSGEDLLFYVRLVSTEFSRGTSKRPE